MSMQTTLTTDRCRLCATMSLTRLPNIELETSNRISTLFQVQIDHINDDSDKLPRTICCHCLASVNAAWMFLERVHRAQRELLDCSLQQKHCKLFDHQQEVQQEVPVDIPCIITEQYEASDPNETWPDYPWNCHFCGEIFTDEQFYRRHPCFQIHRRYFCADCPKVFKVNCAKFMSHIKDQHWDRFHNHSLLQCDICQRWYHSKEAQEYHRNHEHPNAGLRTMLERPSGNRVKTIYECELCGKTYATKPNLDVHKRIHSGVKNFTCDQCGKSFSQKGNLAAHLLTHSTSRPFSCAVCDKTFKTLMRLRKHLDVHSGRKPHICEVCGREFRERGTLRAHVRIHTGAMPYSCEYCGKSFRFKGVLTTHRRQHTGERPYSCLECQHHFTNWPNYNKHMVRRHNINTSVHTRKTPTVPPTGRPQRNPPGTVLAHPQIPPDLNHHLISNNQQQQPCQDAPPPIIVDCVVDNRVDVQTQFAQQHQQQPMVNNVDIGRDHAHHLINNQQQPQEEPIIVDCVVDNRIDLQAHAQQFGQHQSIGNSVDMEHMHIYGGDNDRLVNVVHMQRDLRDMADGGVVYQTTPTVIGMVGDSGGYYTTYNVGGIAHVVTQ